MRPAGRWRRRRWLFTAISASILVVVTVVLSVSWTSPPSVNLLVLAVGIAATISVAAYTYVRLGQG